MDTLELSLRKLDAVFDQAPVALVFRDRELRTRRTNAAFRQLTGLPEEALIGRRPSETYKAGRVMDTDLIERPLAGRVMSGGVPVVGMNLEGILAGERRVFAWSAYRVTDNGRVLGAVGSLTDITALRQANARLDLLQRAGSQIGTTLDIHRTAAELAALAVPELADRVTVDLLDAVLQGEDPLSADPGALRFRRVAVRDAAAAATVDFAVGDLITVPATGRPLVAFLRREPRLARSPAETSA